MRASSVVRFSRLVSTSKIPPQFGQPFRHFAQGFRSFGLRHLRPLGLLTTRAARGSADGSKMTADSRKIADPIAANYPARLKHFLAASEKIVQRFLKMRRALGELSADLGNVLLVTLLNLVLEELLQRAVA